MLQSNQSDDLVGDSLVANQADRKIDMDRPPRSEAFKSLALERYLEGELSFDDLVRIVGSEKAILARDINWAMKEGIESAKADFTQVHCYPCGSDPFRVTISLPTSIMRLIPAPAKEPTDE